MQRFILTFVSVLSIAFQFNLSVWAQKDSTSEDEKSTLSLETGYASNTNTFGNVSSYVNQPSFTSSITYKHKTGASLSFSPIFVGNSDSTNSKFTSEYDFGVGYSLTIWKILTFTPAYTHYLFNRNSTSLKSGFNNAAQLTTGLSIKWWAVSVAGVYGWGQTSGFSLGPSTNATIQFNNTFGKDNNLTFQPTVGLTLNKNELKNLNDKKKTKGLEELVKLYPSMTASDFLNSTDPAIVAWREAHPALLSSISNKLQKKQGKSNGKKQTNSILLSDLLPSSKTKFGLTSINLSLPVSCNISNFSLNASIQYNKPNNKTDPSEFYVSVGIGYSFGL